jgi:uncharacterized protein (TIGR02001 family)
MMTRRFAPAGAAGALLYLSLGSTGLALADSPHSVSANIGAVSNYIWRGVTQTGDQAAIQGGLDYGHESGFYLGTWASNVDFDEGAPEEVVGIVARDPETGEFATDEDGNLLVTGVTSGADSSSANYELDLYAGFGGSINDDLSYDINTIYYAYPDGRDSNFWEIGASGTFRWVTLGVQYTVSGDNDEGLFDDGDLYYYGSFDSGELQYGLSFSARAGYYQFENDDVETGTVVDPAGNVRSLTETANYWHYGASISKSAGDFGTFSLNWDQNSGKKDVGYDNDPKFWVGWLKEF